MGEEIVRNSAAERPQVGVGVMLMRGGRVLLARRRGSHGDGSYSWCGGHLELGESIEECAIREVHEESGLVVTKLSFLCLSNIIAYGKHYVDIQMLAEEFEGEPEEREPHKIAGWGWYPLDAPPTPLFRPVELAIASYRSGNRYNP
ncbi:ADP-ribose pyrophosphatase [Sorangium cellulosum]|uniref:ADP-ribose pyrophosphatase n=1 Tax=Sorangium cellulosum TaxID=56 RepID=A0A2L0EPG8_SORCE|nr:NUDIX domain-containing protein [Sorangium cellulosum]AUX41213.1 ADP-ribose pyrophosphatase [Sorangium cellulosum]